MVRLAAVTRSSGPMTGNLPPPTLACLEVDVPISIIALLNAYPKAGIHLILELTMIVTPLCLPTLT